MFAMYLIKSVLIIMLEVQVIRILKHLQNKTESEIKLKVIYVAMWLSVLITSLSIILVALLQKH